MKKIILLVLLVSIFIKFGVSYVYIVDDFPKPKSTIAYDSFLLNGQQILIM